MAIPLVAIVAGVETTFKLVQFLSEKIPGLIERWESGDLQALPPEAWAALQPRSIAELEAEVDEQVTLPLGPHPGA
jgi:hypothetical protein